MADDSAPGPGPVVWDAGTAGNLAPASTGTPSQTPTPAVDPAEFIASEKRLGTPDLNIAHALLTHYGSQFKSMTDSGLGMKDIFGALGLDISGKPMPEDYKSTLDTAAKSAGLGKYKLDGNILKGLMGVESLGGRNVIGQLVTDSKGNPTFAAGPFQLMPQIAKTFGVSDPYDIEQSAPAAAALLKQNLDRYNGDLPKALKAYQAGLDESKWGQHQADYAQHVQDQANGLGNWGHVQQAASGYLGGFGPEVGAAKQAFKSFVGELDAGKHPSEAYSTAAARYYDTLGTRQQAQANYETDNPIGSKVANSGRGSSGYGVGYHGRAGNSRARVCSGRVGD